jgi:PKD repeat protein
VVGLDLLNYPPELGDITVSSNLVSAGTTVNASVPFTDPDKLDTHTAVWDWGDGNTSAGVVTESNGAGTIDGSHAYATPGIYTVTVTVDDGYGNTDTATFEYVVVYDPNGGFVTGGGWIDSPMGAYVNDPSLTGKANFGFVAKYQKGANVPVGNTEFQFKAGDLNFKSTSYEWLVVASSKAQFKGEGTINGEGLYKFMLTAEDGKPDTFRIKIWYEDGSGEHIVYDNGSQQAIGGGSIVVHK